MYWVFLLQIPPTPTGLPPATPRFEIPDTYSLWASAPSAVQSWNMAGGGRGIFQAVLLIVLVIAGIYIVSRFIKEFTERDSEN